MNLVLWTNGKLYLVFWLFYSGV